VGKAFYDDPEPTDTKVRKSRDKVPVGDPMDDLFESKQPPKKRRKLTKNYEIASEVKEVAKPKKEKKERCDEDSLEEGDYIEDSQGTIEQEGGSS